MITPEEVEKARTMLRDLYSAARAASHAKSAAFDAKGLQRIVYDLQDNNIPDEFLAKLMGIYRGMAIDHYDSRVTQLKADLRRLGVDITDAAIAQRLLEDEAQTRKWAEQQAADKAKMLAAVQNRERLAEQQKGLA